MVSHQIFCRCYNTIPFSEITILGCFSVSIVLSKHRSQLIPYKKYKDPGPYLILDAVSSQKNKITASLRFIVIQDYRYRTLSHSKCHLKFGFAIQAEFLVHIIEFHCSRWFIFINSDPGKETRFMYHIYPLTVYSLDDGRSASSFIRIHQLPNVQLSTIREMSM